MDASIRSRSFVLSVLVHVILFLILLFTVMSTHIPPFPETGGGGGVIVNIGYLDEASGEIQPMSENTTVNPSVNKVKPAAQQQEKIATQDFEESPISKDKKEIKKKEIEPMKTEATVVKETKKVAPV